MALKSSPRVALESFIKWPWSPLPEWFWSLLQSGLKVFSQSGNILMWPWIVVSYCSVVSKVALKSSPRVEISWCGLKLLSVAVVSSPKWPWSFSQSGLGVFYKVALRSSPRVKIFWCGLKLLSVAVVSSPKWPWSPLPEGPRSLLQSSLKVFSQSGNVLMWP